MLVVRNARRSPSIPHHCPRNQAGVASIDRRDAGRASGHGWRRPIGSVGPRSAKPAVRRKNRGPQPSIDALDIGPYRPCDAAALGSVLKSRLGMATIATSLGQRRRC